MPAGGSELGREAVQTRRSSNEKLTRGEWAKGGLFVARRFGGKEDRAVRAELLAALGITQVLELPLPVPPTGTRRQRQRWDRR